MKWNQIGPLLAVLVLGACTKPQAPPSVVPFSLGCQVVRGVEWVPSGSPSDTPESALNDVAEQTGLSELPRSGWTLLTDDGAGRRVYASGPWGVEVLKKGRAWLAVSASTCQ